MCPTALCLEDFPCSSTEVQIPVGIISAGRQEEKWRKIKKGFESTRHALLLLLQPHLKNRNTLLCPPLCIQIGRKNRSVRMLEIVGLGMSVWQLLCSAGMCSGYMIDFSCPFGQTSDFFWLESQKCLPPWLLDKTLRRSTHIWASSVLIWYLTQWDAFENTKVEQYCPGTFPFRTESWKCEAALGGQPWNVDMFVSERLQDNFSLAFPAQ